MNAMKKILSVLILSLAASYAAACGSESSDEAPLPPSLEVPPGVDPTPPGQGASSSSGNNASSSSSSGGSSSGGSSSGGSSSGDSNPADPVDGGDTDASDQDAGADGGTGDQDGGVVVDPPPPPPTSVVVGCVQIDLVSTDGSTFCYQVTELEACKDLSHWDLATNCTVLSGSPEEGFKIGTDPKSGLTGVKWDVSEEFASGEFCLTVDGQPTLATGEVQVASKSGKPISTGVIAGPVCQ